MNASWFVPTASNNDGSKKQTSRVLAFLLSIPLPFHSSFYVGMHAAAARPPPGRVCALFLQLFTFL